MLTTKQIRDVNDVIRAGLPERDHIVVNRLGLLIRFKDGRWEVIGSLPVGNVPVGSTFRFQENNMIVFADDDQNPGDVSDSLHLFSDPPLISTGEKTFTISTKTVIWNSWEVEAASPEQAKQIAEDHAVNAGQRLRMSGARAGTLEIQETTVRE